MDDVERAIRLLRARPTAAALFCRPSVEQIVRFAIERGIPIHGEQGGTPMTGRTLNVYVPNPDAPDVVALQLDGIDPKSAIVGADPEELGRGEADRVLIYFEGNRYGASNVKTFADRAMLAGGRCVERYPTTAMRAVLAEALVKVGTLYLDHKRVEVEDGLSLTRLAEWLDQGHYEQVLGSEERWFIPALDPADLRTSPDFSR